MFQNVPARIKPDTQTQKIQVDCLKLGNMSRLFLKLPQDVRANAGAAIKGGFEQWAVCPRLRTVPEP